MYCDKLPVVENSVVFPSDIQGFTNLGTTFRYECVQGYRMKDEKFSTVRCSSNGEWSNPFPVCEGDC